MTQQAARRVLFIAAVTATLACATPALATPSARRALVLHPRFRVVASGISGLVTSGTSWSTPRAAVGGRYVLLISATTHTARTVLDEQTGSHVDPTQPGCIGSPVPSGFQWLGGPFVLGQCSPPEPLWLLFDIPSGTWRPLRISPRIAAVNATGDGLAAPIALGARWIEFDETCTVHASCEHFYVFQNIQTGAVSSLPAWTAGGTVVPNLDAPALGHVLCRPLRVPARSPDALLLDGSFALATSAAGTDLEHCGSPRHMRIGGNPSPFSFATTTANAHAVVRESGTPAQTTRFAGILLPSLRRFSFTFPHQLLPDRVAFGLASRHFFAVDADGRAWSAAIPGA